MTEKTKLNINNKIYELDLKGNETLLEVLREQCGLTGTKTACEESECGTCAVQVNGKSVLSCITLAKAVEGDAIESIEGLADGDVLHPLQQAFLDYGAVQCGFCIPGMIMSAKSLLEKNPEPTREEIDYALDGNLCRCAGYLKIIEAIIDAGKKMKAQKAQPSDKQKNKEEVAA